jgi:energy-coupling factor transporter ATP-binding protein EcfA2
METMLNAFIDKIELNLENIALFREFRLDLQSGEVVEATGGNGRGKTTLLNALMIALTGKGIEDFLVTYGEEKGLIKTTIAGIYIKRVIKNGKTDTLEVVDQHGQIVKKPQAFLNQLFGAGAFLNPIEIVNMKPAERAKAVAAALDLDPAVAAAELEEITGKSWEIKTHDQIFQAIQQAHDTYYEIRRQKRSEAEFTDSKAQAALDVVPSDWLEAEGRVLAPVEPPALGDIYNAKATMEARNSERVQLGKNIAELEAWLQTADNRIAGDELRLQELCEESQQLGINEDETALEEQIRKLTQQLEEMRTRNNRRHQLTQTISMAQQTIEQNKSRIESERTKLTTYQARERELGGIEDTTALQAQIDAHEQQMVEYKRALEVWGDTKRNHERYREYQEEARILWDAHAVLDAKVKAIDNLPIKLLQGVTLPIPGMVISGEDIFLPEGDKLFNLDAFGEADRYKYCTMLAMALAPVNLIVMDGVEKCDEDRRHELYQMIADAGFCAFSTRVTGGPLDVKPVIVTAEAGPDWSEFTPAE